MCVCTRQGATQVAMLFFCAFNKCMQKRKQLFKNLNRQRMKFWEKCKKIFCIPRWYHCVVKLLCSFFVCSNIHMRVYLVSSIWFFKHWSCIENIISPLVFRLESQNLYLIKDYVRQHFFNYTMFFLIIFDKRYLFIT